MVSRSTFPIIFMNSILLTIASTNYSPFDGYHTVRASTACFNAFHVNQSTIFNAPRNGILEGIILTGLDHALPCPQKTINLEWGCMNSEYYLNSLMHFFTILSKLPDPSSYSTTVPYYPSIHTQNIKDFSVKHHASCRDSCLVGSYTLLNESEYETISDLTFIGPSYNVTTSDTFILQYLSACCTDSLVSPFSTKHAGALVCADVDFLYSKSVYVPPNSLKPTTAPTDMEHTTTAPQVTDHTTTAGYDFVNSTDIFRGFYNYWSVSVHMTYDFSNDDIVCNISCATDISVITTRYLHELALNITTHIFYSGYKITNKTDISFDYTFELIVFSNETAVALVNMYNHDDGGGSRDKIRDHLIPELNEQTRLVVHFDDIILHHDKIATYTVVDEGYIDTFSSTERLDKETKEKKDEWSVGTILLVNSIGLLAVILICLVFYKKNKRIKETVSKYKTQNIELQNQLLNAMNTHDANNAQDDNSYPIPGQMVERLSSQIMPALPPEDDVIDEDSDTSEEMYVEMGATNRVSVSKLSKRGIEGRASLYRRKRTDSGDMYDTIVTASFTRDGDPTGGLYEAPDEEYNDETPGMGEQDISLRTFQRVNSDSHQAFIAPK